MRLKAGKTRGNIKCLQRKRFTECAKVLTTLSSWFNKWKHWQWQNSNFRHEKRSYWPLRKKILIHLIFPLWKTENVKVILNSYIGVFSAGWTSAKYNSTTVLPSRLSEIYIPKIHLRRNAESQNKNKNKKEREIDREDNFLAFYLYWRGPDLWI